MVRIRAASLAQPLRRSANTGHDGACGGHHSSGEVDAMAMMSSGAAKATPKIKAEVEMVTHDGVLLKGKFFTVPSQRVLDVLNDDRTFLPFETEDGDIYIVNKTFIARIRPLGTPVMSTREAPTWLGQ
jgi:hypothetical protein